MAQSDLESLVDDGSEALASDYVPRLQRGSPSAERLSFVNDKPTDPMPRIYANEEEIAASLNPQQSMAAAAQLEAFDKADVAVKPELMPSAEQEGDVMSENLPPLF
jgi:hypothetical protein